MKRKRLFPLLMFTVFMLFTSAGLNAQSLYDLDVTCSQGEWEPIEGDYVTYGDFSTAQVKCPFTFYYDEILVKSVWAGTKGNLSFNYTNGYSSIPYPDNEMMVCPMGGDVLSYSSDPIESTVLGLAPNRVLVVQWNNCYLWGGDQSFYFQVRIYEKNGLIEFIYGPGMATEDWTTGWEVDAFCSFNGSYDHDPYRFYNIELMSPSANEITVHQGDDWTRYMNNDTKTILQPGFTITLGSKGPKIAGLTPPDNAVLVRNYIYGNGTVDILGHGNEYKPSITLEDIAMNSDIHYTISGPLTFPVHSNYHIIYDATQSFNADGVFQMTTATAPLSDPNDNKAFGAAGNLDLNTHYGDISGGLYEVKATLQDAENEVEYSHHVTIAYGNNVEITKAIDPKSKNDKKYPMTAQLPFKLKISNTGLADIDEFYILTYVYDNNDIVVYDDSTYWSALPGQELTVGNSMDIELDTRFNTFTYGEYRFESEIFVVGDEESVDNTWPWRNAEDLYFIMAPEIEAEALAIVKPVNEENGKEINIYVNRPINPVAQFKNNGITDISDANTTIVIRHIQTDAIKFSDNKIIQDIPQGQINNTANLIYDEFTPDLPGDYEISVTINALDDEVDGNNNVSDTFHVINALSGIYTIGPDQNTGDEEADDAYNARNYLSIQKAIEDLYLKGVTGPVTFEFTSGSYEVGDIHLNLQPALDLRTTVVGMSQVNTVTFKPSNSKSMLPSEVRVHLYTGSGIGILFGQSLSSNIYTSVINEVADARKKSYANSAGYFIFDGGQQRSLEFVLHTGTNANLNAVFYLSQGASNITIKNCNIKNNVPGDKWNYYSLPLTGYNDPQFIYECDTRGANQAQAYSTGIMLRSVPPVDRMDFFSLTSSTRINSKALDTLVNTNNRIENNEISGFAYGIVSLGIGPLLRNGVAQGFYNEGNMFCDNYIHNISRTGIFLGYEKSSTVEYNKISNIATSVTGIPAAGYDVAGIILGGDSRTLMNGYNNLDIKLNANEIHNVGAAYDNANGDVYGIKVEQPANVFIDKTFPDEDDNILITNNAIWGIRNNQKSVNRYGIRVFTERNKALPAWEDRMKTPLSSYHTKGVKIANNTILMRNDAYADTEGMVAGLALQQTDNIDIFNNAIAMLDDNTPASNNYYAAIFYQGVLPYEDGGLNSDWNVYWLKAGPSANDSAAVVRYIHNDANDNEIYPGERNEFITMNQWQMYTMTEDFESVLDDFTAELTTPVLDNPGSELEINTDQGWPMGSHMNNRGSNLDYVIYDIDGKQRGTSGQQYDIGAFEFPGVLLNSDVEITTSHQPGAYRATTTTFSDAEYIMTQAPIEVKAQIRNNGSLPQTGVDMSVKIYREHPDGGFYSSPELEKTVRANVEVSETKVVDFGLNDGVDEEFYPLTYGDWYMKYIDRPDFTDSLYDMPGWFKTMENNVTPLYKMVFTTQSDEDNVNNTFTKLVRFYLKRSSLDLIVSVENSYGDFYAGSGFDHTAGKRNSDSLFAYLKDLGWDNYWLIDEPDVTLIQTYDVFERTAWEPRAVDYSLYRTLLWSDADENALTREQTLDMSEFLEQGIPNNKKNLIISSQEMTRLAYGQFESFVKDYLSVDYPVGMPTDPLDGPAYYAGDAQPTKVITDDTRYISGVAIAREHNQYLLRTGILPLDNAPVPALIALYNDGEGIAQVAMEYNEDVVNMAEPKQISMGTATSTLTRNVVYLGADWRHYADGETIMRGVLDYLSNNGGEIIPVELLSFNADPVGDRVELSWETATELNSSRFEIEKAEITGSGKGMFSKIASEDAAGKSNIIRYYGPVTDYNVKPGATYVYRLKMIDLDGAYEYSNEVEISIDSDEASLGEAYPNPASNLSSFDFFVPAEMYVDVVLYNMNGKAVMNLFNGMANAGKNTVTMELSELAAGNYTYMVRFGGKALTGNIKVVK